MITIHVNLEADDHQPYSVASTFIIPDSCDIHQAYEAISAAFQLDGYSIESIRNGAAILAEDLADSINSSYKFCHERTSTPL